MLKIMIPLAHQNPCFNPGSLLAVEVAVINNSIRPETWVSWKSFQAELPFLSGNGERKLYIDIPEGECAIPPGCSVCTIIKHSAGVPEDIEASGQYPPGVMVFNKLSGLMKANNNDFPLLIKWRFTVLENGRKNISPWSYCYKAKESFPDNNSTHSPAISKKDTQPDITREIVLIGQCPPEVLTLDSNLDFVVGAANKGSRILENMILKNTIIPIPGVELEVVSMEGAYISGPGYTLITAENPGVFIYHLEQIPPKTEVVHHIFLKLLKAPIGASQVESAVSLYDKNRELFCETYNVAINIAPKPSTSEVKLKILDTISREEIGMAEILSSEAERIRKVISLATDIPNIISVDNSVHETLKNLIKYQILLEYKMEEALKLDVE